MKSEMLQNNHYGHLGLRNLENMYYSDAYDLHAVGLHKKVIILQNLLCTPNTSLNFQINDRNRLRNVNLEVRFI